MKKGFSVVELMVVLAVLGILLAVGSVNLVAYQRRLSVKQAMTQLATDLNKARMDARRLNKTIEFVASAGGSSYEVGPVGGRFAKSLPDGVSFNQGMSVSFAPPYGLVSAPNAALEISGNSHSGQVSLVGILGKVVTREM